MKEETIQWEKTLCLYFAKRELGETLLKKKKKTSSGSVAFHFESTAFKWNRSFPTDQKSVISLAY